MTGARAILEVQRLAWGHDTHRLGSDLDLTLADGECLAIIGPNGAGKSTLLRTLAGLLPPLSGHIAVAQTRLLARTAEERARLLSFLPQEAPDEGSLTVTELVELGRTPHLGPWGRLSAADRAAVDEAIEVCGLTPLAGRPLGQLSGGERQRARIAMTLAQATRLLLLDEPVSHLDLRRRFEFYELVSRLRAERGLATVMVLHDIAEAYRESSRVLVLSQGAAHEIGVDDPSRAQKLAQAFEVPESRIPG